MRHLWFGFLVLLFAIAWPRSSQGVMGQSPHIEDKPSNCEIHIGLLDLANKDAGKDGLIIMIGHLGYGESNQQLNYRRLYSTRAHLTEYLARSPETIIIGEGEQVSGYGRIELYIGGKLHTSFAVIRNADFSVGSCEPPALDDPRQRELRKKLYPWDYGKPPRP